MSEQILEPSDDRFAAALRGFGPLGILAILVILAGNMIAVPLSALLVLVWIRLAGTPLREIGYVMPRSWIRRVAAGIAFGRTFKFLMLMVTHAAFDVTAVAMIYWNLESAVAHFVFK